MTMNQLTGSECPTEIAKLINLLVTGKSDTDLGNLSAAGQAILDGKASISLNNLSAAGQAILDKKVEVEALLQQNGYAKFTWKENNQISNLLIQWFQIEKQISNQQIVTVSKNLPHIYTSSYMMAESHTGILNVGINTILLNNLTIVIKDTTTTTHTVYVYILTIGH